MIEYLLIQVAQMTWLDVSNPFSMPFLWSEVRTVDAFGTMLTSARAEAAGDAMSMEMSLER